MFGLLRQGVSTGMRKKIALAFVLVTLGCVAVLGVATYLRSQAMLKERILSESAQALATTELKINQSLETVKEDALFLAGTPPLHGIMRARRHGGYDKESRSTYDMWVERLQEIMSSRLRSRPDYWQIRYIDERGNERVRVDSLDGVIKVVPKKALQNKAEYAYFTETMKLPAGAIYVSPLNLNRERGRIEMPHRPTLRMATPVYSALGEHQGIVVINLHAVKLLENIRIPRSQAYLVNQDGFFLAHPDPAKTFGFDLGFDYRLQNLHPRLAEKLHGDTNEFVEYVDDPELPGATKNVRGFRKIHYDPNNPKNYWAVVFDLPASVAFAPIAKLRNDFLKFGALIAVLGAIAGLAWAGRFSGQAVDLATTAERIAQGHTDLRVPLANKRDEFLTVGQAFNRMVESLVSAERRLANILDTAGDAIISVDEDQRIVAYNRTAEQIFGYAAADALGKPLDILLPSDIASAHHQHVHAFGCEAGSTRGVGGGREIAGRRVDGSVFPAEASISKVTEGARTVFTAILRDITERKRAENALQEKDKLLTAVGTMAKVGGWEFDARTLQGTWTDQVARIHDMNPKEGTGAQLGLTFYQGESREKIETAVKDAIEQAKPYDLELEMTTAKGKRKWVRTMGQPVVENGVVVKVMGAFQDITERKHAEEEIHRLNADLERKVIERTAQLQAANQELEAFSYSVSHDLRAPLRAIDGFSQILLEDNAGSLNAEGSDSLQRIRAATHRMGSLIDDLLKLSRVTRAELNPEETDLSALAQDVVLDLRRQDPGRDTELTIAGNLKTQGDPRLLRIALQNLLDNAWKFTRGRPGARIVFDVTRHEGKTTYFVRDSGVGFDMAHAGKLFGAFQRLHDAREFPGTGIGLATVQRVIHRHGGRIWAESAAGQGTTFYFTLS